MGLWTWLHRPKPIDVTPPDVVEQAAARRRLLALARALEHDPDVRRLGSPR